MSPSSSIKTDIRASFDGLKVGSFESRMKPEMERLIENLGGVPFVAPSMKEVPLEENKNVFDFWTKLNDGQVDLLILFTGVGTRTLFRVLQLRNSLEEIQSALKKTKILVRGPKPAKALAENGLVADISVPEPNTWREILKTIDEKINIDRLTIAVQEYGESNRLFLAELVARGAQVFPVPIYKAVLPDDKKPLQKLIAQMINKDVDVVLFTNATQVDHAMAVAREEGKAREFRRAFSQVVVGSVGPTCTNALHGAGIQVDIEPERPMMGALVATVASSAKDILEKKRKSSGSINFSPQKNLSSSDPLQQSLFLKACRREKTVRTPVWLMRQAGRYMKEYRELRARVSFIELCKNSDLAAEVTVDAAHRLEVDAAIIFSDLLLLVEPMGFQLSYGKDQGPEIGNPFRSASDMSRIKPVDVENSMSYVYQAIRKTRQALKADLPLIGFAGAPFTMASYIIEGKGSKNFINTKRLMYDDPNAWHALLEKITTATIDYVNGQIEAGAQAIQIFDSWVGCLSPEDFRVFALPHTKRLIKSVTPGIPVISFGTQTAGLLPLFREAGGDVIGVDWRIELDEAWDTLGEVAIQGNLDPVALFASKKEVVSKVQRILNQAGGRPGHIFNLGHGILPETPIENVFELIKTVKEYRLSS